MTEPRWTACYQCDRGGRGNAVDKCACGWQATTDNGFGCYLGSAIVGTPRPAPKLTRGQRRYRKYLEVADCFANFRDFLRHETRQARALI